METTVIVLLDYEAKKIKLFGKAATEIDFCDAHLLKYILKDENILYLTAGEELDVGDIVSSVSQLVEGTPEPRYIRSTTDGYLKIEDVNIIFAGPKDPKPMERLGNVFERSQKLRTLLKEGKVKLISETEAKSLRIVLPGSNLRDASLNKIILNKSHEEALDDIDTIFDDENEINENTQVETDADAFIKRFV